jgi:hypothetical protein
MRPSVAPGPMIGFRSQSARASISSCMPLHALRLVRAALFCVVLHCTRERRRPCLQAIRQPNSAAQIRFPLLRPAPLGMLQATVAGNPRLLAQGVFDLHTGVGPLHMATRSGQLHAMRLLLELGAGLEWRDGAGLTALQVRGSRGCTLTVGGNWWEWVGVAGWRGPGRSAGVWLGSCTGSFALGWERGWSGGMARG